MSGEPRFVRVSDRGRWHRVVKVIDSTGALNTACGRIIPAARLGGWEVARRVKVVDRCGKCEPR
jgi:hypothetical protein